MAPSPDHQSAESGGPLPLGFDAVDLIAAAAHELNTPLSTISGIAHTLRMNRHRIDPEDVDALFVALEDQSKRLAQLLKDLLSLSTWHHREGSQDDDVVISDAIADAIAMAPPPPRVALDVHAALGADDVIAIADASGLARVIVNLLTNAYKYGGRHISVTTTHGPWGVQVAVEDDGPGVPGDLRETLFVPFVRGSQRQPSEPRGAGLGLALARQIIESFGGQLRHEEVRPHGARFAITLPEAPPAPAS